MLLDILLCFPFMELQNWVTSKYQMKVSVFIFFCVKLMHIHCKIVENVNK